jgi:HIRAN domain
MAPAGQVLKDFTLARVSITVGAHSVVQKLRQGQPLQLARDPKDQYDANAVMVIATPAPGKRYKIGYLPLDLAKKIAPLLDAGVKVIARKAHDPRYGVCELAYVPPVQVTVESIDEPVTEPVTPPVAEPPAIELEAPADAPVELTESALPEGITQQDLDEATPLPPLGDSRRPRQQEEYSDDERDE